MASHRELPNDSVVTLRKDGPMDIGEQDGRDTDDYSEDFGAQQPEDIPPEALKIAYQKQIDKKREERYEESMENTAIATRFWEVVRRLNSSGLQQKKFSSPARFSTHPVLVEAILFLRFNKKYWTQFTVSQAVSLV
jgi:hypothetical protein